MNMYDKRIVGRPALCPENFPDCTSIRASAPRPYTVSVGKATTSPSRINRAASSSHLAAFKVGNGNDPVIIFVSSGFLYKTRHDNANQNSQYQTRPEILPGKDLDSGIGSLQVIYNMASGESGTSR